MPPVTPKRQIVYAEGTPQQELLDAVDAKFATQRAFVKAVARKVGNAESAVNSTFYGFLGGRRSLPDPQRRAYMKLTGIRGDVLDAVEVRRIRRPARRFREGWVAAGKLEPLWNKLLPDQGWRAPRRDALAALTGINESVLSELNTGVRDMTVGYADAIIRAMRDEVGLELTYEDLGRTPAAEADRTSDLLQAELAADLRDTMKTVKKMDAELRRLRTRVGKLEGRRAPAVAETKRPRSRKSAG